MSELSIPLHFRVPRPPAVFVGRHQELARLTEALVDSRVALVHGESGMGKSALVRTLIHRNGIQRAFAASLRPGDTLQGFLGSLLVAMSDAVQSRLGSAVGKSVTAVMEQLVALADQHELVVVLDDLHNADVAEVKLAMRQVLADAQKSTWIFVGRSRVSGVAVPHCAVEGLDRDAVAELAQRCMHDIDPRRLIAIREDAKGSPWTVRFMTVGRVAALPKVGELSVESRSFLEPLALLHLPVSLATLKRLGSVPAPEELRTLVNQGLLEDGPAGYRMHDAARVRLFESRPQGRDLVRRTAEILASDEDVYARMEAARLFADNGQAEPVLELMGQGWDEFCVVGMTGRLWRTLSSISTPSEGLDAYRWRLASLTCFGEPLAWARRAPRPRGLEALFDWAVTREALGKMDAARQAAQRVLALAQESHNRALAFKAGIFLAVQARTGGNLDEALHVVQGMSSTSSREELDLRSLRARLLMESGELDAGRVELELATKLLRSVPPADALQARKTIACAYQLAGQRERAFRLLSTLLDEQEGRLPYYALGFEVVALVALDATLLGESAVFRKLTASLDHMERVGGKMGLWARAARMMYSFFTGTFEGLDGDVFSAQRDSEALGQQRAAQFFAQLGTMVRMAGGAQFAPDLVNETLSKGDSDNARIVRAWLLAHEARSGGNPTPPNADAAAPIARVHELFGRAECLAAVGEREQATAAFVALRAMCREGGMRGVETVALAHHLDAVFALGAPVEVVAGMADELEALAQEVESPRFALEARFIKTLATERAPHPVFLQGCAKRGHLAPMVARRAQAILGRRVHLDERDRIVLARMRDNAEVELHHVVEDQSGRSAQFTDGWGYDVQRKELWTPGGRVVSLSRRPLARNLLHTLARLGGKATKEELATNVWERRIYEPSRDDARIQVAIHRLRVLVEEDAEDPKRICTVRGGYEFGAEPFTLVAPSG